MIHRRSFLVGFGALGVLGSCKKQGQAAMPRVAVIPKGTTNEFWKTVHAGVKQAAQEEGIDAVWKGPLKEDDLKAQIELVQSFVAQRVAAIVLAPLSDKALLGPVKAAKSSGIPVVIFDSALQGEEHDALVATDNLAAGRLAAEEMQKVLGGKGKVVVLRYLEGSASTMEREKGFLDTIRKVTGIEVVSDNQYGGATTESAFSTSETLLSARQAATGGVDGIFAPNESTTFGMLLALRKANLAGKIKFIGFDASDKLVEGVRQGHLHALVLQNPRKIGYMALKRAAQLLRKEPVERRFDTGAQLVTRDNLDDDGVRELLRAPEP
ncbi:MAG TPA: substrate-binding domain-containing protein [Polyangiaceae bacterium]|nr:substrate-binding domain-containing protein [Polyangiaceae bacterium]